MSISSEAEKESIEKLLVFLGRGSKSSSQKTLVELDKIADEVEEKDEDEGYTLRKSYFNDFATVLDTASHRIKFEAVYRTISYFSQFEIKDFTIVQRALEKLDEYKGKDQLSDSDVAAIAAWGNSLMEFSYGFESDKDIEEFEGHFGKQIDEFDNVKLERGIGLAALSLLPVKFQSPGANDFIGSYPTGPTEGYIRCLGMEFVSEKFNLKGSGPMSPNFSLAVIKDVLADFLDWLEEQK